MTPHEVTQPSEVIGAANLPAAMGYSARQLVVVCGAMVFWFVWGLYIASDRGSGLSAWFWLALSLGLIGMWVLILLGAYRSWRMSDPSRVRLSIAACFPAPLAATLVILSLLNVPFEVRWDLSRSALGDEVQKFEASGEDNLYGSAFGGWHWAGFYRITYIDRRGECILLHTHSSMDYYAGFAYCESGRLPDRPCFEMKHIEDPWWTFDCHH